jgi:hypothetical protein
MLQTTTLKRNLIPEIGRKAKKKGGFGFPRWLPPLKENSSWWYLDASLGTCILFPACIHHYAVFLNRSSQKLRYPQLCSKVGIPRVPSNSGDKQISSIALSQIR